ncbi:MAG: inorganic phosphate transporter [Anaerolineales bacterium]|nr:inorganic phosphate transporter [Anaerolineales bacterium]
MFASNLLTFVVVLALSFVFLNAMRDSGVIVATMISSRAFSPRTALGMTAVAEFIGPLLFGATVARTIGGDIVDSHVLTLQAIMAGLLGALVWNLITWFFGIPSSSSHALIGGLTGAVLISAGVDALKLKGFYKVLIALFASPIIGFVFGFIVLRVVHFFARDATPRVNWFFKRGQFLTTTALALSYGANDGQKLIGVITLSLIVGGHLDKFDIPLWVTLCSASAMAFGALLGGWRLIRTLGGKFYKIRPVHSFAAQLTSASVILTASLTGLPVSTTQVVSSAIIGVGSSERLGKVRWGVAGDILTAWIVTIPISALFAAAFYWLLARM